MRIVSRETERDFFMDKSIQMSYVKKGIIKTCIIENCNRQSVSRNLCSPHYQRLMKTGNTDGEITILARLCKIDGCINESASLGLCRTCYSEYYRRFKGIKPSFNWKGCVCNACGKSPVRCKGLCNSCYRKHLRANNLDRFREKGYEASMKQRFGGNLEDILTRADYECKQCGMPDDQSLELWNRHLDIHHIDGNGRTSEKPNHDINNLLVLCRKCHMIVHHPKEKQINREAISCV